MIVENFCIIFFIVCTILCVVVVVVVVELSVFLLGFAYIVFERFDYVFNLHFTYKCNTFIKLLKSLSKFITEGIAVLLNLNFLKLIVE